MIRHIVLFKMNETSTTDDRDRLVTSLLGLKESTGGLMKECAVHLDVAHTPNSYDLVLNTLFDSMDTLNEYIVHPKHKEVVDYIKKVCASTVKVDYPE